MMGIYSHKLTRAVVDRMRREGVGIETSWKELNPVFIDQVDVIWADDYKTANYEVKLMERKITDANVRRFRNRIKGSITATGANKFFINTRAKAFYGLTCMAFVDPQTALYQKLVDFRAHFNSFKRERIGGHILFSGSGVIPYDDWRY